MSGLRNISKLPKTLFYNYVILMTNVLVSWASMVQGLASPKIWGQLWEMSCFKVLHCWVCESQLFQSLLHWVLKCLVNSLLDLKYYSKDSNCSPDTECTFHYLENITKVYLLDFMVLWVLDAVESKDVLCLLWSKSVRS